MKALHVFLAGREVALLEQTRGGQHRLHYSAEATEHDRLSISLPVRAEAYGGRAVDPFLEGLLPDRQTVRQALAQRFSVSPRNPFALLEHIGLDCAGAVQFVRDEDIEMVLAPSGALRPLSDDMVAQRLQMLTTRDGQSWLAPEEGWSLAGAQVKIALRYHEGRWYEARGSEPTTHILKPGIVGMREQALGEHVCMAALGAVGLAAAKTEYTSFGQTEALVVQRYDRIMAGQRVIRIHQEDLCQATGTYPARKYEADGGPSAPRIAGLLARCCDDDGRSVRSFVDMLIANVLLGAPDGHAKNYSILHVGGQCRLAPCYDIASGLPYERAVMSFGSSSSGGAWRTSAMAIGGRRLLTEIGARQWSRFAADADLYNVAGMSTAELLNRVRDLAQALPEAVASVISRELGSNPALEGKEIPSRLLTSVQRHCRQHLERLPQ